MALGNWDTFAIDINGKHVGSFTSPLGVRVIFYKNWLEVKDPTVMFDNESSARDVIIVVNEGKITYRDVEISAIRGPQEGIYAVVHSGYTYNGTFQGMIGCGVYGYGDNNDGLDEDGHVPFVGVRRSSKEFLQNWISKKAWGSREEYIAFAKSVVGNEATFDERHIENIMSETVFDKVISEVNILAS